MRAGVPTFEPFVGPYLARQDWAQAVLGRFGAATVPARIVDAEVLRTERPGLASVVAESDGHAFHLVVGWRDLVMAPGMLAGAPGAVLGPGEDLGGEVLVYDALADDELVRELLAVATGGRERAERSRLVRSLVSHSSIIFDERLFMKCYRVIEPRPRPEVETVQALERVGFAHLTALAGRWRREGRDLGLVREFVPGSVEGVALAQTSLRDLLARAEPGPGGAAFEDLGLAGGDLGPEARRLGGVTAELHLALAEAFGRDPSGAVRLHGDYHLRRVFRTDRGWIVAGFGDDPLLGSTAGTASTGEPVMGSPLEDVADLCWSFGRVAAEGVDLCPPAVRRHAAALAEGWRRRNVSEVLRGYLATPGIGALVTADPGEVTAAVENLVAARAAQASRPARPG